MTPELPLPTEIEQLAKVSAKIEKKATTKFDKALDLKPEQETIEPSIDQALIEVVKKVENSVKSLLPDPESSNDDTKGPVK